MIARISEPVGKSAMAEALAETFKEPTLARVKEFGAALENEQSSMQCREKGGSADRNRKHDWGLMVVDTAIWHTREFIDRMSKMGIPDGEDTVAHGYGRKALCLAALKKALLLNAARQFPDDASIARPPMSSSSESASDEEENDHHSDSFHSCGGTDQSAPSSVSTPRSGNFQKSHVLWSEAEDSCDDSDELGSGLGDYSDDEDSASPAPPVVIVKKAKKARKAARKEGCTSPSSARQEVVLVPNAASRVNAEDVTSCAATDAHPDAHDASHAATITWLASHPADRWSHQQQPVWHSRGWGSGRGQWSSGKGQGKSSGRGSDNSWPRSSGSWQSGGWNQR